MARILNLSFAEQVKHLLTLADLAEESDVFATQLQQAGFTAFVAWQSFAMSFCEGEERRDYEAYVREESKVYLTVPDRIPGHICATPRGYVSPLMEEMRRRRDATNGIPVSEIADADNWKMYISPCERRRHQLATQGSPQVRARELAMYAELLRRRSDEIELHSTSAGDAVGELSTEYARFFTVTLAACLEPMGFKLDAFRSTPFYPVFSKPLTPDWDLCWSLETDRNLRLLPKYGSPDIPMATPLDLLVYVRAHGKKGFVHVSPFFEEADTMLIQFQFLVWGFGWAYERFRDARELETILKAHCCLYRLVANRLEDRLSSSLST